MSLKNSGNAMDNPRFLTKGIRLEKGGGGFPDKWNARISFSNRPENTEQAVSFKAESGYRFTDLNWVTQEEEDLIDEFCEQNGF